MSKVICMTGSPVGAGFKTKATFLEKLSKFGFEEGKITKKNNVVNILVTNELDSETNKMNLAKELGIEIMTYEEIKDAYDLEPDEM